MGWRAALVAIVAAGLILRVAIVFASPDFKPNFDSADYDRLAAGLARTGHLPGTVPAIVPGGGATAFRPPALPHALAAAYVVAGVDKPGRRWKAGRLTLAIFGAAAAAFAALVALQLAGQAAALGAAALTAIAPALLMSGSSLLTEPIFITLMLAAAAAILRYRATGALRWAIAAGVLGGLTSLTRANGVLVLVAVSAAAWPRSRGAVAAVLACGALVVAPWTIRNAIELDAFVPVSTETGFTVAGMYNGQADEAHGRWTLAAGYITEIRREHPDAQEPEWDEALLARAREYVADHPAYPLDVAAFNSLRLFSLYQPEHDREVLQEGVGIPPALAAIGVYGAYPVLALVLIGFARGRGAGLPAFLWFVVAALALSAILLGGGNARYRAPVEVLLIVGASVAYLGTKRSWTPPSSAPSAPGSASTAPT